MGRDKYRMKKDVDWGRKKREKSQDLWRKNLRRQKNARRG